MGCFNFCLRFLLSKKKGTYRTCDVHFFGIPRFDKQTLEAANLPHVTYTPKFIVYLEWIHICWSRGWNMLDIFQWSKFFRSLRTKHPKETTTSTTLPPIIMEGQNLSLQHSGQIIIFHQSRFPWNKGISLPKLPFGVRSSEVAIIWPEY